MITRRVEGVDVDSDPRLCGVSKPCHYRKVTTPGGLQIGRKERKKEKN